MHMVIDDADTLTHNWGAVVFRGIVGILFGLLTLFRPGISLAALVLVFGVWVFVDGIGSIVSAIRHHKTAERWWVLLLEGIAGVLAGLITLFWPKITALTLLIVIAVWALVTGVFEIVAAIRLRKVMK